MKPLYLQSALKEYIWGGTYLKSHFNKKTELPTVAESWELSCHKDGISKIINDPYQGLSILEVAKQTNEDILGTNCNKEEFPVLIKLIDAKDNLSIQVHPNDEYAKQYENSLGKTEMWYIVDCEPSAFLYYGFNKKISKEEFKQRIENGTITEVLNAVAVKKGDVFFIEAGTLHAIGKGIVIAEVQQSSNTTYRIYDYGRTGADGKPRELHIDKALDVTQITVPEQNVNMSVNTDELALVKSCNYFTVLKAHVTNFVKCNADEKSFHHLLVLDGAGEVKIGEDCYKIEKGTSMFIPANTGEYKIIGTCEVLLTKV